MRIRYVIHILFCIGFTVATVSILYLVYQWKHERVLRVDVLNIGQGDALLITTPDQHRVLIDTGPDTQVTKELAAVMPFHVRTIDMVLLTHPDLDHIGGTIAVLDSYDVGIVVTASSTKENEVTKAIDEAILADGAPRRILRRGAFLTLDASHRVYAEVLAPDSTWHPDDSNDSSIVLKVTFKDTCFLFTGDASIAVEQALIAMYQDTLRCDVLKVGHHGSRTSTSKAFVGFVQPSYAIISAGVDNAFGHPHQEVLDILKSFNVTLSRTDTQGRHAYVSDGTTVRLVD